MVQVLRSEEKSGAQVGHLMDETKDSPRELSHVERSTCAKIWQWSSPPVGKVGAGPKFRAYVD